MKKTIFLLFIGAFCRLAAQTPPTIAVLDFENKAILKDLTINRISDKIINEFSAKGEYIVYDRKLIDTMMSGQGTKNLLKCREESCLFAIGHLLGVDLVLSGSISKQNKQYMIYADLIDIKNNTAMGSVKTVIANFYDSTFQKSFPGMVAKLFELIKNKEIKNALLRATQAGIDKRANAGAMDSTNNRNHKKAGSIKGVLWSSISIAVLGGAGAAAYYYKYKRKKPDNNSPIDDDILLDDAPTHPPKTP